MGNSSEVTASQAVNEAVQKALLAGNAVEEKADSWEKVREVVHMRKRLDAQLREELKGDKRLRYWSDRGSPHNRPAEGFLDEQAKVAIEFPLPHP